MNKLLQGRLLVLAAGFLFLQALSITISPAVWERTANVTYLWSHWLAFVSWAFFTYLAHISITKYLPDTDPYLFPIAAFISGWGILTIWRLDAAIAGPHQAVWFAISVVILIFGLRLTTLDVLRRYKYVLLSGGLLLTALTLLFGTNPGGIGPRLWLGCCDVYFQPSEPLKLLLIAYLAAYFADKLPSNLRTVHLLYPTVILSGVVIMLLLAQRDLGTASIFIALYTIIIYLTTERKRVLLISVALLFFVSIAGYYGVGIIHARIDSWLNPWSDPSGSSYQIIQAMIAIANGGIEGRGPGLGSPGFVPVASSDFIYTAIGEETGLFGTLGLLALFSLILARGFRASLRARDIFHRFLAAGITAYFGVQTILIVGGNLRLLPLTGVTLPFISYGGSSFLTSFIGLLLLLIISNHQDEEPAPLLNHQPYTVLSALLLLGIFASALTNGWWAIVRGPDLLTRTDNPRLIVEERYVPRGKLLDQSNAPITTNIGDIGSYKRYYNYTDLAPITGYTHGIYGQAGLEAALDEYLRGTTGNSVSSILTNQLLYGMSPNGLDVRLSIDLKMQQLADELLNDHHGAVILLNAQSGEILVIASHPTFNPNDLDDQGSNLAKDKEKPLINRASLGLYLPGSVIEPFEKALFGSQILDDAQLQKVYKAFGFYKAPSLRMQVAPTFSPPEMSNIHITPLQLALASAALSNHGIIPAPRIAMAINSPTRGWLSLPALATPTEAIQPSAGDEAALSYQVENQAYWQHLSQVKEKDGFVTWYIGGTPPNWQATPLVIVVLIEENNPKLAQKVGQELLTGAMKP